jgi:SAM-dependent methyltransferase
VQPRVTLWSALCVFWRENAPRQGRTRTLRILADELREFARDSMPGRRRQRYGDMGFDFDRRVDTTAANVSRRDHLIGLLTGTPYQPCDPDLFRETVGKLGIDYPRFTFVDVGSGKGRALLLAAEYPFHRIVGVEWVAELHRIAQQNARKFESDAPGSPPIQLVCGDARAYQFPAGPLLVFLFNPLPEAGLQQVIANLEESLRNQPRPAYIVYHNPLLEHLWTRTGRFAKIAGTMQWAVYSDSNAVRP